jgi:hypothetical protein
MSANTTPNQTTGVLTTEAKPGYRTTEFWITVLALVVSTFQEAVGLFHITDSRVLLFQTFVVGAYTLSRGFAKSGAPALVKNTDIK